MSVDVLGLCSGRFWEVWVLAGLTLYMYKSHIYICVYIHMCIYIYHIYIYINIIYIYIIYIINLINYYLNSGAPKNSYFDDADQVFFLVLWIAPGPPLGSLVPDVYSKISKSMSIQWKTIGK